ncbi:carbohydrate ABC transporter permease [Amycolatopsis taiwanensis]|uniref:Sugar ABC transporter permease n=1 Tax=Amycolatopsis taiwanensis TaxID=342230 RepID=A0A9W6R213_9PSEU|nr:sugar ABC transporter permease [Amycolatopsis taiwanensis]GLY68081.1 sugar ABC transporter permease [Amycolatopsis taiwanensis]
MTATQDVSMPARSTPPASTRVAPHRPRRTGRMSERIVPYLLILPALVAILVLLGWPTLQLLGISLRRLDLRELVTGQLVWVGFDNFTATLSDPEFWQITVRTVVFTAAIVLATLLVSLFVALLMRHLNPVIRVVLQVTLVLAWATPVIATTTVFQWMFDQQYGILNKTLDRLGFHGFIGFSWFSSGASTLTVIGLLILWQAVPFVAFTLYAGLLGVPAEQFEAAAIDGAGAWQSFWAVTWPAIRPIVTMVTFLSVLWDFKVFSQVWAIRQGGPDGESTTLPVYLYLKGIAGSHFGASAAIATLMLIVLAVLTGRYIQLLVRTKEGDIS